MRPENIWVERALSPRSQIVDLQMPSHVVVDDAREPMLSADGQSLAFIRDDHGRGRLRVRRAFQSDAASESALTPSSLDVYEASFVSDREYAFSAVEHGRAAADLSERCNARQRPARAWGIALSGTLARWAMDGL